jgi:uncharacterized protein (DUF58 family)
MIFPERQLLLILLLAGFPAAILYSLCPDTRSVISVFVCVFFTLAVYDAFRCWHIIDTISISLPDTLRMYRGFTALCYFNLKTYKSVRGRILGDFTTQYIIEADTPFSLEKNVQEVKYPVSVTPLERGVIGHITLRILTCSTMRFWCCIKNRKVQCTCSVFANNKKEIHLLNAMQSGDFAGNHLKPILGKGREVDRLRNYIPGDSMGDIHWKAMARHGFPVTKEYRIERSQSLYVVIDSSCFSKRTVGHQTISGNNQFSIPVPLIERSIITADILIMLASRQGDRTGLAAFDNKVRSFISADAGMSHLSRCRKALLELKAVVSPSDYREMFQFLAGNIHRRSMILILADLDDPFISESFTAHSSVLAKKHVVCGVCPVNSNVQPLFSKDEQSVEQIYAALSGHLKWQSVKNLQNTVRKNGSEIIIATHDNLAVTAIRAYIAMKRNQPL